MGHVSRTQGEGSVSVKYAFIVNNYPPRTGGVEFHVQSLARELLRLGHQVLVVTLGDPTGWRDESGIRVLTLPEHMRIAETLGFPGLGTRRRLTRLLKAHDIDIVSVHTRFFPMTFIGWRAARAARIPVIHTEHGSDHVASDSTLISAASRLIDHTLGRASLRGADRVLGVSEEVTAFVQRLAGVTGDLFYNAIDAAPSQHPTTPRAEHARPNHFVFVGRIVPGKGWSDYLEAFAQLKAAGVGLTGEIIGEGPDLPALQQRLDSLGLNDDVTVRGRITPPEVREALNGATLVNPTTLSEGFQTTLLEALAEGGRVVTYPVPGARLLQQQGAPVVIAAEASLTALMDAMIQSLTNPAPPVPPEFLDAWVWPTRGEQYVSMSEYTLRKVSPL